MGDEEVLKAITELKKDIKDELKEEVNRHSSNKWFIGPLISIIVIIAGILVNWGIMTAQIDHLDGAVEANRTRAYENQLNIMELRTQQAVIKVKTETILENVQKDVNEIKKDVKKLIERQY